MCFPSYAFSLLRADGGPIAKIKSLFRSSHKGVVEIFTTPAQKRLTYKFSASTMVLLTCTYVYVLIRSEQAEEGARSFLLLWLV
jgi:hypothetical protein